MAGLHELVKAIKDGWAADQLLAAAADLYSGRAPFDADKRFVTFNVSQSEREDDMGRAGKRTEMLTVDFLVHSMSRSTTMSMQIVGMLTDLMADPQNNLGDLSSWMVSYVERGSESHYPDEDGFIMGQRSFEVCLQEKE
jgi:hypothetical protein